MGRSKPILEIKDFKGGSNKLLDEARLSPTEAKETLNLLQVQDGLWKVRWGSDYYGMELPASCSGAKEFVKSDGSTEIIAIAGTKAYSSTDGGSWTEISGATFTAGLQCYFMQIAGYLYIANGTDSLVRYNGTVLTTYTELSAPASLSGARVSGLVSGVYTYYAEVTALNDIGETVGSNEASLTVNKLRDNWLQTSNEGITWSWSAVSGATRYQLYLADESGDESLLVSTTTTSYTDYGELVINPYVQTPIANTTGAPKFKSMCVSGNRIWATNNDDSMYTVYFSGTGHYIGTFSDFYGGGFINLEKGGREIPQVVLHYQSGQGEGRATVLAKTPEGQGAVWQIQITDLTVGDYSFPVPSANKIIGSFGTDSILGVVQTTRDAMFPNKRGWFSVGPEKNYYGILITNELSSKIRNYWRSLESSQMSGVAAYFYDAKVFISVPTTTSGNSRIIIYDLERGNWTVDWDIGAKQFFEYTDSTGTSHLLYVPLSGTKLIEIGENIQGDLGTAFRTRYVSGRLPLSKYWKDFVKVTKTFIKLGNPRGAINFEVSGTQKNKAFQALASATITPQGSDTGMGWDVMGSVMMGETLGVPSTYSDSSDPHYVKIRKKLRDIQFRVTSETTNTDYILQGFIVDGVPMRTNPPNAWKLS